MAVILCCFLLSYHICVRFVHQISPFLPYFHQVSPWRAGTSFGEVLLSGDKSTQKRLFPPSERCSFGEHSLRERPCHAHALRWRRLSHCDCTSRFETLCVSLPFVPLHVLVGCSRAFCASLLVQQRRRGKRLTKEEVYIETTDAARDSGGNVVCAAHTSAGCACFPQKCGDVRKKRRSF
jgi:hypothetical protein